MSSLARKDPNNNKALLFRQIELNWINAPNEDANDYLALYLDSQPDEDNKLPVSVHRLAGRMNGQLTTDYYLPLIDFYNETLNFGGVDANAEPHEGDHHFGPQYFEPHGSEVTSADSRWRRYNSHLGQNSHLSHTNNARRIQQQHLEAECVGYCVAYHSKNKILAKSCLQTNPSWMQESFQYIGSRALPTLMIPGTHNSGTYAKQLDKSVLQMINKYQMNQDESIFSQLVYGIRHLDLRVGYAKVKQRNERLWVYHDIFRTEVSLSEVFKQVARFLELTSHEIIIMDFHRFTVGFQNETPAVQRERHARLIEMLFRHLGRYVIPSYLGQHAPLQEYVSMGKRLLVGYADRSSLVGGQADQHSSIFALYTQQAPGRQPVRDVDAIKQDQEDLAESVYRAGSSASGSNQPPGEPQADRRMGTRIYNKLKSLKLISYSFSKRSATVDDLPDSPKKGGSSSSSPSRPSPPVKPHLQRLQKEEPHSAPMTENNHEDDDLAVVAKAALFFPQVRHLWPNKDTIDGLAQYMNETTCRKYFGELRSMMVELTPTVFGAISDKYDGNRRLAQLANRQVTDWIRDRWLHCINVVASDFFLGNDLIRLSIQANKMRQLHRTTTTTMTGSALQTGGSHLQGQQCSSFRRVEHLLDRSKIAGQQSQQPDQHELDASNVITHTSRDGKRHLMKAARWAPPSSVGAALPANFQQASRERRESFVDNVSDSFVDLFASFKRLLNL